MIWKLSTNKTEILGQLFRNKEAALNFVNDLRKEIERDLEVIRRELEAIERRGAEPIFAIREKVATVELYIRDQYVSKREYERDHAQLLLVLRNMQEALEKRLDSYEDRVEKALAASGRLPLA